MTVLFQAYISGFVKDYSISKERLFRFGFKIEKMTHIVRSLLWSEVHLSINHLFDNTHTQIRSLIDK